MFPVLQAVLAVLSLLCVTWSLVLIAANKPLLPLMGAKRGLVGLLSALEIGLLVQAVVGVVQMPCGVPELCSGALTCGDRASCTTGA